MRRTPKGRSEAEKALDEDVRNAQALGVSYGRYKALCLSRGIAPTKKAATKRKRRRADLRKFEDKQALDLWKKGLSDARIGERLGVRRQAISAWRHRYGLPTQQDIRDGLAQHSDYVLMVDGSGELIIGRRSE